MSQNDADTAAYISELMGRARKAQKVAEGFSQEKVDELAHAIAWEIAADDELLQEIAEFSFEECQLGDVPSKVAKVAGKCRGILYDVKDVAVSADGTTVIGIAGSSVAGENFRWTADTGAVLLGSLDPSSGRFAKAEDISGDGSTIVGVSPSLIARNEAFKWTLTNAATGEGTMVGLGDLPGGGDQQQGRRIRGLALQVVEPPDRPGCERVHRQPVEGLGRQRDHLPGLENGGGSTQPLLPRGGGIDVQHARAHRNETSGSGSEGFAKPDRESTIGNSGKGPVSVISSTGGPEWRERRE